MRRFRVSIAVMLVWIALAAVSLAALLSPSPLWGNTFYSLVAGWLTLSVLGAIYSRGRRRAGFVGFAACGWAYFLAIFGPTSIFGAEASLVTTAILEIAYPFTVPRDYDPSASVTPPAPPIARSGRILRSTSGGGKVILAGAFGGRPTPTNWENWTRPNRFIAGGPMMPLMFHRIGHSIFALLFAQLGSLAARRFHAIRDREAAV